MKHIIQHSSYSLIRPEIIGVASRAKIAEDWIFNKLKEENVAFLVSKNGNKWSYGEHHYGHRPGIKPAQWAMARVYSFVMGGKTTEKADKDLWEMI